MITTITLYFADHEPTNTCMTVWYGLAPTVAGAVLAALFQRFPDSIQNIKPEAPTAVDELRVSLRTRAWMPTDWADGSVLRPVPPS